MQETQVETSEAHEAHVREEKLRRVIKAWKKWHRALVESLPHVKVYERAVTLTAVRNLVIDNMRLNAENDELERIIEKACKYVDENDTTASKSRAARIIAATRQVRKKYSSD